MSKRIGRLDSQTLLFDKSLSGFDSTLWGELEWQSGQFEFQLRRVLSDELGRGPQGILGHIVFAIEQPISDALKLK
jgi:hypothetical protein